MKELVPSVSRIDKVSTLTVLCEARKYCKHINAQVIPIRMILENYFKKGFTGPPASGQCSIRDSKEHLFAVSFGEYEKLIDLIQNPMCVAHSALINHMIFG